MADLVFNALNGPELKAVILAAIAKKLDDTGEFSTHMTYPWVSYTFNVGIVSYPKQAMDAEPGIVAVQETPVDIGKFPTNEEAPEPATVTQVHGGAVIDTPDKARLDADLPLPTTAVGLGGVIVDKPIVAPPAPEPSQNRKGTFPKKGNPSGTGTAATPAGTKS
jgi:hypothetical protein